MLTLFRVVKNIFLGRPILTIFDVTKLCNERCPMCNIWKTKSNDMSIEEIEQKAEELKKFGVGYVFIQGGEPTIRKDLIRIVDIFLQRGIKPTIITNGILLNEQLAREVSRRKCNLSISVDTMNRDLYMKLRGADKLDEIIKNIEVISKIKDHKGNWAITTTITKLSTLEDVQKMYDFARKHGFMYAIRPYVFVNGIAGKTDAELSYCYEDVKEIFEYMLDKSSEDNYLANIIYRKHVDYIKGKPMKPCDAMKYSFLLKETGEISPCIEYPNISLKLGGVRFFKKQQIENKELFCKCNKETPCFYNDAREIGILLRNIPNIILHSPKIIKQMVLYGNFF